MDDFDEIERKAKRRLYAGYAVVGSLLLASLWLVYSYFFASPSPATICRNLADHLESVDFNHYELAPEAGYADTPRESFEQQCALVMGGVRDAKDEHYADAGRCIVWASDLEQANKCLNRVELASGQDELDAALTAAFESFPTTRPAMPPEVEPHYDTLTAIAEAALAECPNLYEPQVGCYAYVLEEQVAPREATVHPIPGPEIPTSAGVISLEAKCSFDAASFAKAHPEIVQGASSFPLPVQSFACNFGPRGPIRQWNCAQSAATVGGRDNVAVISEAVPGGYGADPERCTKDLTFVDIRRTTGDGVVVEVLATFRR